MLKILTDRETYVEIQKNPQIIICQPENAWDLFLEFLSKENYIYSEDSRFGSMVTVEKDNILYHISFSLNKYYSLWEFEYYKEIFK